MIPEPSPIDRRDPSRVMRLERLGSLHQSRLSFMRTLTRRMAREQWQFSRPVFEIASNGVGVAVYTAQAPQRAYSLVAFAHDLPADQRSDRVIANAWDATFCLFDGIPSTADVERLARNVPLQEAGRISEKELTLSRANRSVRLWKHVVDALAAGAQPDPHRLDEVGYLMRTTAVYGSGKFGAADRERIADRPEMSAPFQAEMLTVYLIRVFILDLVQFTADLQGGNSSVDLDTKLACKLGVGNSTGLGMAPFIIHHPVLLNNWILAREEAVARVRSVRCASSKEIDCFRDVLQRTDLSVSRWHSAHPIQLKKISELHRDLIKLKSVISTHNWRRDLPWNRLVNWAEESLSVEGQELLLSLILEPYGELVDELAEKMADATSAAFCIDGSMSVGQIRRLIERTYRWALNIDWSTRQQCFRIWYVSEEKQEPRLGERTDHSLADYEQPLAPARDVAAAFATLSSWADHRPIAEFLLRHAEYRKAIRRVQISQHAPYGEIRDNTISKGLLPIDLLRAKLSFFGAIHFDPRSDRWVRICMYAGAPYPKHLTNSCADFWVYPELAS